MKKLLRKLRGILGTGITWALGWGALFGVMGVVVGAPLGAAVNAVFGGGFLGACAGVSFAAILSIAERRRTLEELSLRRVAIWGGLGGMALLLAASPFAVFRLLSLGAPLGAYLSFLVPMGISGLLGTAFATGSVYLARREDRKLLAAHEDGDALARWARPGTGAGVRGGG